MVICDNCGRKLDLEKAVAFTRSPGQFTLLGLRVKMQTFRLCPECAERRRGLVWFDVSAIVVVIALFALCTLIYSFFQ